MMTKAELIAFLTTDHEFADDDEVVIVDNGEVTINGEPYAELTTEREGPEGRTRYLYMLPIRVYRAEEVFHRHCFESGHI